ncbi:MAG: tetratricopeptide repeat protein, partial [Bdellovibrionota bacterium]
MSAIGRVLTTVLLSLALTTAASAAPAVDLEAKTRAEDLAAASAFKSAAQKIALLTLKKEGAHDELPLMVRLMETLNRVGAVQFRLVHSATNDKDTLLASTDYHVTLSQIVGVANRFLKKFPSSQEVARVMFLRAKSYRDLGQDADAVRDFRALIDRYPDNEDLANAEFTLYELLIKAKDYRTAIAYLKRFQALPTEDYYPLYLDHLAFAHYFVNEIPEALRYLEQELARFTEPTQREKVLQNSVLFYFTGIENPHGTLGEGIAYLKKLNPGAATGKLLVYYGNLLRSKGHDDQIDELKRIVLASDFMPADDCELLFNVFENELNKGRFAQLRETADELNHWIDKAGGARRERTQKLLADAASHLQEIFSKTRSPAESARVSPTLTSLYELMLKTTTGAAALQKIRFNLAELRFALKDYDGATTHYRWIAENGPRDPANAAFVEQAALKAIGARYESLSLRHVFPKELAPRALPGTPSSAIPPQAAEWVSWVAAFPQEKQWAAIEVFVFEADRFLYSQGHLEEALANLKALMHAHPTSKFAVPAASLVLDTEVASEHWSEANTYATELLGSVEPGKTEFRARLLEIASDSYFKILGILYKAGQYAEVLVKAETFLKTYPTSPRKTECLALAASSSLATHDKKRALAYFSPILNDQKGQPEVFGTALLTRASVAEERYDFESASADYRRYLNLPAGQRRLDPKELEQLKGKTLLLSWLSGSSTSLRESLAHPVICPRAGNLNCEKFTALLALAVPADP